MLMSISEILNQLMLWLIVQNYPATCLYFCNSLLLINRPWKDKRLS